MSTPQPRVVIVGARGQLGSELPRALTDAQVSALGRAELELTDPTAALRLFAEFCPAVVINCAAFNRVDDAERDPTEAFAINAFGVRTLARACSAVGARLIHVSTDYVFDGRQTAPYEEPDCPRPLSAYGISKLNGELFAVNECPEALIIRTSGLYGLAGRKQKGGRGHFVETILTRARARQPLRIVADQVTAPSCCREVAEAIVQLMQAEASGVFHVTNGGQCSWFEFAQAICELSGLDAEVEPTSSAEFFQIGMARRPGYSVLANRRYAELGFSPLRHWRDGLAAYLDEQRAAG